MLTEVLLAILFCFLASLGLKRYQKVRLMERIPGPPALPLLGNALDLLGSHEHLFKTIVNFTKYGDGVTRIYLGLQQYCLLSKGRTAEELLGSNVLIDKSDDYVFLYPWIGTGLLTSTGQKWKSRRRLLTPTFHFKILEDFVEVFNRQALRFVDKIQNNVGDKPFNVYPSVTLFTLDVIMETAMGNDINVQNDEESDYVKAVVGIADLIQTRQFSPWLHSDLIFKLSGLEKKQRRYIDTLHAMSLGAIRTRRIEYNKIKKQGAGNSAQEPQIIGAKKRLAFLDLLLEASESSDARLTDEDLREEVDTFMFEGHDTTAAALSFTIYLLGRHPQIQARVVQELNDVLGEGDVTITTDALRDLKLLEACIKEALRIFPSVPFVGRKLLKPATLNGYELPAGTNVIAMIYCIHRDPEQFPNPEEFNPDRFLGDEVTKRHPYSYVPFSAGPRNCIGQKFALMEEKVMMAHFLRTYEVTAKQSFQELGLLGELILRPDHGVMVTLQRRK